jgi:Tfp pilus assembly protein PilN
MPAKKEINLLPKAPWEKGWLGGLIHWGLAAGRPLLIFTELIVIGSFLWRFSLDRQLSDLHESIKRNQTVIESYGDFEARFKQTQQQLQLIKTSFTQTLPAANILEAISQFTPVEAVYDAIIISGAGINLEGSVLSETGLSTLLTGAQSNQLFSSITLDSVASATTQSPKISFKMSLTLTKQP